MRQDNGHSPSPGLASAACAGASAARASTRARAGMTAPAASTKTAASTADGNCGNGVGFAGHRAGKASQVANSSGSQARSAVNHRRGEVRTGDVRQGERRPAASGRSSRTAAGGKAEPAAAGLRGGLPAGVITMPPHRNNLWTAGESLLGIRVEVFVQHGPFKGVVILRAFDFWRLRVRDGFPGAGDDVFIVGNGFRFAETLHFGGHAVHQVNDGRLQRAFPVRKRILQKCLDEALFIIVESFRQWFAGFDGERLFWVIVMASF